MRLPQKSIFKRLLNWLGKLNSCILIVKSTFPYKGRAGKEQYNKGNPHCRFVQLSKQPSQQVVIGSWLSLNLKERSRHVFFFLSSSSTYFNFKKCYSPYCNSSSICEVKYNLFCKLCTCEPLTLTLCLMILRCLKRFMQCLNLLLWLRISWWLSLFCIIWCLIRTSC